MPDTDQDEIEWVVVRSFDNPVDADIAMNFLRDHGIDVALRGNSGATMLLNRFQTVVDIRIVVPLDELEDAEAALVAMDTPAGVRDKDSVDETPYRAPQWPHEFSVAHKDDDDEGFKPRSRAAALIFAFAVPIGSGHFYARHERTGTVLAAAILSCYAFRLSSGISWVGTSAALLILMDAVMSRFAVSRYNERQVASETRQWVSGLVMVAIALALGFALSTLVVVPARSQRFRPARASSAPYRAM